MPFLFTCLLALQSFTALAITKHAIVVGVADYPNLDKKLWLDGPRNDVEVVMNYLLDNNFDETNITLLADDEPILPTYKNILIAFEKTINKSKSGDMVYLHFSGHGSQQPQEDLSDSNQEHDGLDEIFLPRDVKNFNYKMGKVENALVDNEVNLFITRFREKGVFVWLVFDSCHAGTMLRGTEQDGVKHRKVEPNILKIPSALIKKAKNRQTDNRKKKTASVNANSKNKDLAGYIAFYAAQSTESTIEMKLPQQGPDRKPMGLFTYTISDILSSNIDMSYTQLSEAILNRYTGSRSISTPIFEGSNLNTAIFNSNRKIDVAQWKVLPHKKQNGLANLSAGQIHGINSDTILALVKSPSETKQPIMGYIQVIKSDLISSTAKAIGYNGIKPIKITSRLYARAIGSKIETPLTIWIQPDKNNSASADKLKNLLKSISADKKQAINIKFTDKKDKADFHLAVDNKQILFTSATIALTKNNSNKIYSLEFDNSPRLNNNSEFSKSLTKTLRILAKTKRLYAASKQFKNKNALANLDVSFKVTKGKNTVAVSDADKLSLYDGNIIEVTIRNNSKSAVDVTALYIDSGYGISPIFPTEIGATNRIQPKSQSVKIIKSKVSTTTLGNESLIIIAVEAKTNTQRSDFSFLAQPSLLTENVQRKEIHTILSDRLKYSINSKNTGQNQSKNNQNSTLPSAIWSYHWQVMKNK